MPTEEGRMIRVFVSSTFIDNEERRKVVHDAILRAEAFPVGMERFTASTLPVVDKCLADVQKCDWLIGILAHRYGWIPPGQPEGQERSITEMEYDAAAGKPRLMFMLDGSKVDHDKDIDTGPDRWKKQDKLDAFKLKIQADQMPGLFKEETLGVQVYQAIMDERDLQARRRREARDSPPTPAPRPPPPGSTERDRELVAELARSLGTGEGARLLLQRAGFAAANIPTADLPTKFWSTAIQATRANEIPGGVLTLIEVAEAWFPDSQTFKRIGNAERAATPTREKLNSRQFATRLDRHTPWDAFVAACFNGAHQHLVLWVVGDSKQNHELFYERIRSLLREHDFVTFGQGFGGGATAHDWADWLSLSVLRRTGGDVLDSVMDASRARNVMFLLDNQRGSLQEDALDDAYVGELVSFVEDMLVPAIEKARPEHAVRLFLAIQTSRRSSKLATALGRAMDRRQAQGSTVGARDLGRLRPPTLQEVCASMEELLGPPRLSRAERKEIGAAQKAASSEGDLWALAERLYPVYERLHGVRTKGGGRHG